MDLIYQMLELQQKLNDSTNGKDWENGVTKNGKIIDWKRCIYMESAELIDSYPWKHWKNIDASVDIDNAKIEVVDIWHFVMSLVLQEYKLNMAGDINFIANEIKKCDNYKNLEESNIKEPIDIQTSISNIENMLKSIFTNKTPLDIVNKLFIVAIDVGLDLSSIYRLYIGKNMLNIFRQDNGYKSGEYIKVWNNQEDNMVMQNLLSNHKDITPDELYFKLQEIYSNL